MPDTLAKSTEPEARVLKLWTEPEMNESLNFKELDPRLDSSSSWGGVHTALETLRASEQEEEEEARA
eukprot:353770-Rhodomonas_salina.4